MIRHNRNRNRVSEIVSLLPGIHLRRLARLTGLQSSTTRHHLKQLEKEGRVTCVRDGEYLRAFPATMNVGSEIREFSVLHHRAAKKLLKGLLETGSAGDGVTGAELAKLTGLSESTVSECLGGFRELGLVKRVPGEGGRWTVMVEEDKRNRLSSMVDELEHNFLSIMTDNYVDLWDL